MESTAEAGVLLSALRELRPELLKFAMNIRAVCALPDDDRAHGMQLCASRVKKLLVIVKSPPVLSLVAAANRREQRPTRADPDWQSWYATRLVGSIEDMLDGMLNNARNCGNLVSPYSADGSAERADRLSELCECYIRRSDLKARPVALAPQSRTLPEIIMAASKGSGQQAVKARFEPPPCKKCGSPVDVTSTRGNLRYMKCTNEDCLQKTKSSFYQDANGHSPSEGDK